VEVRREKAAAYAKTTSYGKIQRRQIEMEKERVYKPINQKKRNIGWKELNTASSGSCRTTAVN
jgi:hypothetical protein